MAEACEQLGTPVTGGNVSLYNESPASAVYPTPVIGMVGLIDDLDSITRSHFSTEGDTIVLLGTPTAELGGSEYLARVHHLVAGAPPHCDLKVERDLIEAVLASIEAGVVRSAHDSSDGGLAVALAECCIIDGGSHRSVVIRGVAHARAALRRGAGSHHHLDSRSDRAARGRNTPRRDEHDDRHCRVGR